MVNSEEISFINKFIIKGKQERYKTFLENDNKRKNFTKLLSHFTDLNWKMFREILGNEIDIEVVSSKVKSQKNISVCTVISENPKYDKQIVSVEKAIDIIGAEGTILIFGNAEVVYYEGEAPNSRYISL